MEVILNKNEKLEDLQCNGLHIIQSSTEYRFTTDAVVLANFVRDLTGKICVEFGTGSGVVALLVATKKHPKKVYALEIQPQLADMAQRSVELNNMQDTVCVLQADIKQAHSIVPCLVDAVVCNPPYRKVGSGQSQQSQNIALCRHEIAATLSDVVQSASAVLNNKGSFYLVHQSSRLCEVVCEMAKNHLFAKEILPICPKPDKQPTLVLIRAVKNAQPDCVLHSPMYIMDENGNYTPMAKAWYDNK